MENNIINLANKSQHAVQEKNIDEEHYGQYSFDSVHIHTACSHSWRLCASIHFEWKSMTKRIKLSEYGLRLYFPETAA